MAESVTISNLSVYESPELPGNSLIGTSSLFVELDVTWSDISTVYQDRVGVEIRLKSGHVHGSGSTISTIRLIVPLSGASGSAHITGTVLQSGHGLSAADYHLNITGITRDKAYPDIYTTYPPSTQYWDFSVYTYSLPSIASFTVQRCTSGGVLDEAGIYAKVNVSFVVSPIGNNNTKALAIKYREFGTSTWSSQAITITALGYTGTIPATVLTPTFDATKSYEIKAEITDLINTGSSLRTLSPAYALLHLNADKDGIGAGSFNPDPGFKLAMDLLLESSRVPQVLKALGIIAAKAIAVPRGTHTSGGGYYLERWVEVSNDDNANLVPWARPGASGYINGWRVKRAGKYQINFGIAFDSGSTAAVIWAYVIGALAANEALIADNPAAAPAVDLAGAAGEFFRVEGGSISTSVSSIKASQILQLPVDAIVVAYASLTGSSKSQDTNPRFSQFSIARVG